MLNNIRQVVLDGEMEEAAELTKQAVAQGIGAREILDQALTPAMDIVGEEYERGDRYVPEMLISAEAMKGAVTILKPLLVEAGVKARGKVVIGTVEGDLHDIGKDLVAMMLEGAGFEVVNLGAEVTAEQFVEAAKEHGPDILGMSALLTTTMVNMPKVIDALKEAGLRDQIKVLIGGRRLPKNTPIRSVPMATLRMPPAQLSWRKAFYNCSMRSTTRRRSPMTIHLVSDPKQERKAPLAKKDTA